MDTEHLKEFLVMAKTQNYTSASEELYISQSSIFKHVRALESELDVPLFERSGKKVVMTDYGKMLVDHAEIMLKQLDEFHEKVQKYNESKANIINLIDEYPNPQLMLSFRKKYPRYSINHVFMSTVNDVLGSDSDLITLKGDFPELKNDFDSIDVTSDTMVVVLPLDHPLAGREYRTAEDIKDEDFIGFSTKSSQTNISDSILNIHDVSVLCSKLGFEPNIVMSTFPGSEVARLVLQGAGISLLMRNTIVRRLGDQVAYVKLVPEFTFPVRIYYRKNRQLSPAARAFIDYSIQWYKDNPV